MMEQSQQEVVIFMASTLDCCYIEEQIATIRQQEKVQTKLSISVDGLTKSPQDLIAQFNFLAPNEWLVGPNQGFAQNFLSMVFNSQLSGEYYAFCDHDDLWEQDKLARAVSALKDYEQPALYCSRTLIVDELNQPIGLSPLRKGKPSFNNALVQTAYGGNTMVFNQAALELLRAAGCQNIISHDWWLYLLVTGAGGKVIYDASPTVRYRQHRKNIVGKNRGLVARIKRLSQLLQGDFKLWTDVNLQGLQNSSHLLTTENQCVLAQFNQLKKQKRLNRICSLVKSGFTRQSRVENWALYFSVLLNRF